MFLESPTVIGFESDQTQLLDSVMLRQPAMQTRKQNLLNLYLQKEKKRKKKMGGGMFERYSNGSGTVVYQARAHLPISVATKVPTRTRFRSRYISPHPFSVSVVADGYIHTYASRPSAPSLRINHGPLYPFSPLFPESYTRCPPFNASALDFRSLKTGRSTYPVQPNGGHEIERINFVFSRITRGPKEGKKKRTNRHHVLVPPPPRGAGYPHSKAPARNAHEKNRMHRKKDPPRITTQPSRCVLGPACKKKI